MHHGTTPFHAFLLCAHSASPWWANSPPPQLNPSNPFRMCCAVLLQVLNNLKSQLSDLVAQGQRLRKEVADRKAELGRFDNEMVGVSEEADAAGRTVRRLKTEQEDM